MNKKYLHIINLNPNSGQNRFLNVINNRLFKIPTKKMLHFYFSLKNPRVKYWTFKIWPTYRFSVFFFRYDRTTRSQIRISTLLLLNLYYLAQSYCPYYHLAFYTLVEITIETFKNAFHEKRLCRTSKQLLWYIRFIWAIQLLLFDSYGISNQYVFVLYLKIQTCQ